MYTGLHVKRHHFCGVLMKPELSRQIFEKMLKYQILLKSFKWEQSCSMRTDGWTDRHDETNSRLSQFCEGAYKTANFNYWDVKPCVMAEHIPSSTPSEESVRSCLMSTNLYGHSHENGNLSLSLHRAFCSLFK